MASAVEMENANCATQLKWKTLKKACENICCLVIIELDHVVIYANGIFLIQVIKY